jgi:hypothetical protein
MFWDLTWLPPIADARTTATGFVVTRVEAVQGEPSRFR